ncbi:hypothetical protein IMZ48_03135 [Candidatus Bathyarchaeota archaeon]|nr:hypothetical protein [Candidatus Bathyarchaeota archaeon]
MWNDEDNNPYGTSFSRSEEEPSSPESPQCASPRLCRRPSGKRWIPTTLTRSRSPIRRPHYPDLDDR